MRYVPNLIPPNSGVEIDIDFRSIDKPTTLETIWAILSYIGAALFLIRALGMIFPRFWEGILSLIVGVTLLPQGHRWIEDKLKFRFTWLLKGVFLSILILILIPVSQNYSRHYEELNLVEAATKARLQTEENQRRIEEEKRRKEQLDSLNYYNAKADEKIKLSEFRSAIKYLEASLKFTATPVEIIQKRADCYFNSNQIDKAIEEYSLLIGSSYYTRDNYYKRALCYQKSNKRRQAVSDLKEAIALGNESANSLHEQINPIKKRVSYYVTRCCDGSTSNAKGRGACSHHRGVCNWNDPVYEEYRDF